MVENRVGPPVRGTDFYGREALVDLVWEKLEGGHVLLAAPRRFGKTSLMYWLIDEPRGGCRVVHADLEHLADASELITELVARLAVHSGLAGVLERLTYYPRAFCAQARKALEEVELPNLRIKLREQAPARWQERGEELFGLIEATGCRVILVLDELPMMIDRMARSERHREEARTLLRWLRALRSSPKHSNVRFVVAGSIGIGRVLNELGEISSINDFEQVRLDPFTAKVAAAFIEELCATHEITLSAPVRRKMLELIGTLVPYFIQVLFSEVCKAHKQEGEAVTPRGVEAIYQDRVLGVDCKTYFDHYYERLRDCYPPHEAKAARRVLRELAMAQRLDRAACYELYRGEVGSAADEGEFVRLMADLENDFYVRYDVESRRYEFACKLLRDWWLRHYGIEAFG